MLDLLTLLSGAIVVILCYLLFKREQPRCRFIRGVDFKGKKMRVEEIE